jgi:uncharacterized OsmC-like protein
MTSSTQTRALNDVNLPAVAALTAAVQNSPQAAQTTWKADVEWTGAFTSQVRVCNFPAYKSDEPAALGGGDTAPNPVEQLLGALGNCLAVGYAANASAEGITIRDLRISLEGNIDLRTFLGVAQDNAGYQAIQVRVKLDTDASPEKLAALHRKVTGTSPVGHTLQRAVPLNIELTELAKPEN